MKRCVFEKFIISAVYLIKIQPISFGTFLNNRLNKIKICLNNVFVSLEPRFIELKSFSCETKIHWDKSLNCVFKFSVHQLCRE